MSLLTIIQTVADEVGIPRPSVVVTSNDPAVRQLLRLANREGQLLQKNHTWQQLVKTATFSTVAGTGEYALTTIASNYDRMIPMTQWDRSGSRRLLGPQTDMRWEFFKSGSIGSYPYYRFRIADNKVQIDPVPTSVLTFAFEYISKHWCQSSLSAGQSAWAADTDTGILDEQLMEMGIIWRWLRKKGLSYDQEYTDYLTHRDELVGINRSSKALSLDMENDYPHFIDESNLPETGAGV